MKKFFPLLIILILSLTSCTLLNIPASTRLPGQESGPLFQSDAVMLEAVYGNMGLVNAEEDYWSYSVYTLSYNGDLSYYASYNLSGKQSEQQVRISDDDLRLIYDLLLNKVPEDPPEVEAYDGENCKFNFFAEDGSNLYSYHDYIYGTYKEEIMDVLNKYILRKD